MNAVRSQTDLAFTCVQCQDDEARASEMPDVVDPTQHVESTHLEKDAERFQIDDVSVINVRDNSIGVTLVFIHYLSFLLLSTLLKAVKQ